MAQSHNFNNWMYEEIFPVLHGDILEIGSGLGTFSEKIIKDFPNSSITLSEISTNYLEMLKKKFQSQKISIFKLELNSKTDYDKIGYEKYDSIFALNVLEHVKNDEFALEQLYKMLKRNGKLVLLVPCHKFLYNKIDENVGHYRRYTKNELKSKIFKTKFKIEKMIYFNMLGIIGWYINGNLFHDSEVNPSAAKLFEKIVPIEKFIEKIFGRPTGLSIICYLKK